MREKSQKQIAMSLSIKSISVNIALSLFKLFAGIFGSSAALISDAIHSATDVFSTLLVMISIGVSRKDGRARAVENIAAIAISMFLLFGGMLIGYTAFGKIALGSQGELAMPSLLALFAALVSIGVKEWMFWFTRRTAKQISSEAMMADAWHQRLDALASVGSLIGICAARLGVPIFDPIAGLIICFFILKAAVQIFFEAIQKLRMGNKQ